MPIVELTVQGGGFRDSDIAPGAAIDPTKVIHQYTQSYLVFPAASTITALTYPLSIINPETSELVEFEASIFGAAGGERTATVDLHKSAGGAAFATILSSTITFSDTNTARTSYQGVISDIDLEAGDILAAEVTVAGSSGTQPTGLLVTLTFRERPTT